MNNDIGKHYECIFDGKDAKDHKAVKTWKYGDKLRVIAFVDMKGHRDMVPVFWNENRQQASTLNPALYEPWKTEEDMAIDDMLSIVQSHYRETVSSMPDETMNDENWKSYLSALYENGYRKT